MRILVRLLFCFVMGFLVYYVGLDRSEPVHTVVSDQRRPDLAASFTKGNYTQYTDHLGNVARAAFDASGKRIGVQVGKYSATAPNGMMVEMTYLEPDADHPLGQAFDGAGNPKPLNTGRSSAVNEIEA